MCCLDACFHCCLLLVVACLLFGLVLAKFSRTKTTRNCIVNKEKVGQASLVGSITFSSPLEHLGLTSFMAAKYCGQSNLDDVTQSCPSPGISFIHTVQGAAQVSRITNVNSVHGLVKSKCEESMASTALKDIHMPERLMENFYIHHSAAVV